MIDHEMRYTMIDVRWWYEWTNYHAWYNPKGPNAYAYLKIIYIKWQRTLTKSVTNFLWRIFLKSQMQSFLSRNCAVWVIQVQPLVIGYYCGDAQNFAN